MLYIEIKQQHGDNGERIHHIVGLKIDGLTWEELVNMFPDHAKRRPGDGAVGIINTTGMFEVPPDKEKPPIKQGGFVIYASWARWFLRDYLFRPPAEWTEIITDPAPSHSNVIRSKAWEDLDQIEH